VKKLLITGAGGFIGSHLAERCVEQGFDVTAFVHYNSRNSWGWLDESPYQKDLQILAGDVRDFDSVFSAMKGKDTVFHLAALIGIPYSYESPIAYIETNVKGTYNILQCAKQLGLDNVLITSTSETYGTAQYVPIDEKHPLEGQSPYSASKIGADHLSLSYFRSFGLPVKVVRPFNVYGPRQSARAIIPTIVTQILNSQDIIKLGNTSPTRDLTFVKDTVSGFLEIAKSDRLFGEVTNIGMNEEVSIADLAGLIVEIMETSPSIETEDLRIRPENSEVLQLRCDSTKIKRLTQWEPEYSLKKGLLETIDWLRENRSKYKPGIYNI